MNIAECSRSPLPSHPPRQCWAAARLGGKGPSHGQAVKTFNKIFTYMYKNNDDRMTNCKQFNSFKVCGRAVLGYF